MSIIDQYNAARFVRDHSFDCEMILDGIAVYIPCSYHAPHPLAGSTGVERIECRTIAEVRLALGY